VLLAGAGMLLSALLALQAAKTGYDMRQVLALDVPSSFVDFGDARTIAFYREATERIGQLPGVLGVAAGSVTPWRDIDSAFRVQFKVEGYQPANGEDDPRARFRIVAPNFFAVLGVPLLAGRDFTDQDRADAEPVVIVSQSVAKRLFPNGDAVNRHLMWAGSLVSIFGPSTAVPRRIVGVVADVDDENIAPGPAMTVYHPLAQLGIGGRLFVHAAGDPYALVPEVTRVIHQMSSDQPVERAATLEDVRADVLSPERLNAFVFSGFAGIALLIAVVGIAGVLAFSVSARTREFGVRLAIGSAPRHLLTGVLSEGAVIAAIGIAAGAVGGYALTRVTAAFVGHVQLPGVLPLLGAATVLAGAAIAASLIPAARASRVDVLQALRSE
jgi:putative ABC transport system permease protein